MTMKEKQMENHGKIAWHMISLFKIIPNEYQSTFPFALCNPSSHIETNILCLSIL